MRDILPSSEGGEHKGRSIRNISIEHTRSPSAPPPRRPSPAEEIEEDYSAPPPVVHAPRRQARRRSGKFWRWAILVVLVSAGLGLLLSTVFAGAKVVVYAKRSTVTVPPTLRAELNAPVGTLSFESMSVTRGATTSVPATGTTEVRRQASGVAAIFNAYDTKTQRLIANTRFEAPDGKIYRIRDSVTVPGATRKADGTVTPGSISVTLYADSPGEEYNKPSATTFTIPGFKGDPRYTKFSARTENISGGFVGQEAAVAPANLSKAKAELERQLDADVRSAAAAAIPEGYVTIPGTLQITFSAIVQKPTGTNSASLSQSATAKGLIVRAGDLATALARGAITDYKGEAVLIEDLATLSMQLATSSKPSDNAVIIQMTGSAILVWQYDPNALEQALISKPKSEFNTIVASFAPALSCTDLTPCSVTIRPFWESKFPIDPERIKIETKK